MKANKGDVILLCILFATFALFAANEYNILAGVSQFDTPAWTLFGVIFGGELLSFALYKIGMAKYETKDEKGTIKKIEKALKEMENENQESEEEEEEEVVGNHCKPKEEHKNESKR